MTEPESASVRVLAVSFYGEGLLRTDVAFSGAFLRQEDYAVHLRGFESIVPCRSGYQTRKGKRTTIYGVPSRGTVQFLFSAYRQACQLHRAEPYDVVMVDNPHLGALIGFFLKRRLGTPLIVHAMADTLGNPWYVRERFSNRVKHLLMRFAFRIADVYRVSTKYEVERLQALGYRRDKIHVVPFYIDQEHFLRQLTSVREGTTDTESDTPHHLLYVGRIGPQKDCATLLRAFHEVQKKFPDAHLSLVGSGPDLVSMKTLAESLGVASNVTFHGAVPHESVVSHYAHASVFVLTSLYEGTCMVLHEATLAGLPIVATDTAGAHDLLAPEDGLPAGWLAPVRDSGAVALLLGEVLTSIDEATGEIEARTGRARTRVAATDHDSALVAFRGLIEAAVDARRA